MQAKHGASLGRKMVQETVGHEEEETVEKMNDNRPFHKSTNCCRFILSLISRIKRNASLIELLAAPV